MKQLTVCFCILLLTHHAWSAMNEKQMKSALKLLRNVCQSKHKATDEQIDAMHKGDWNQDRNGQCYVYCLVKMYKLIRPDNSFDWEGGIKTIQSQAPPSIAGSASASVRNCKDAVKTPEDKCIAGYEIVKCIYMDNPEKYFLP